MSANVQGRAVVIAAFGLDSLETVARGAPSPGHGEALVRIEAVSLNRRDVLLTQGVYNPRQKLPIVPCSDGAGTVVATGPGCTRVREGDRVVIHMFPGWLAGEPDREKLATGLGGPGGDGTLRQFMSVNEQSLIVLPPNISIDAASTLPCAALTAWSAVVECGQTRAGDHVLVQGTGGRFAVRFATCENVRRACGRDNILTGQGGSFASTRRRCSGRLSRQQGLGRNGA